MRRAFAPVGQRRVIVDADKVNVVVSPERIEVEIEIARAVTRRMRHMLRPVRRVGNFRGRQYRRDFSRERFQRRNSRVYAGSAAGPGETTQFRTDEKALYAAGRCAQHCIVQHHAAIGPFVRS